MNRSFCIHEEQIPKKQLGKNREQDTRVQKTWHPQQDAFPPCGAIKEYAFPCGKWPDLVKEESELLLEKQALFLRDLG